MRLLLRNGTGEFSLTKDLVGDENIPSFAILSHTWGPDGDEVTFEDLVNGTGKDKAGYQKIRFCGEQARQDGLQYFWIDTCCINRANYTELSQAINSMFGWYHDAARCYAYLTDVSSPVLGTHHENDSQPWESEFQRSRWFKRGWTLQELLAPRSVEFFSREGRKLGDKSSLQHHIHEATRIAVSALQGVQLSQFTVDERLSWIEHRQTKLEEDKAYSLLGIFGVHMPLIYGERRENAFRRLKEEIEKCSNSVALRSDQMQKEDHKCVKHLRLSDPRDDKKRIEDTKGGLLKDSYNWILSNHHFQQWRDSEQSQLLWIKGDPGKGKTMLLCGIIDELKRTTSHGDIVSFLFLQATDPRINSATAALRGLLYLIVDQQPSAVSHIRKKYDHAGKALFEDANAWVALCEIFTSILQDRSLKSIYFIIDALDECVVDRPKLLDFLVQQSTVSPRAKWIVSSRNWPDIEEQLAKAGQGVRLSLELNAESVSAAVEMFIQQKVLQLSQDKKYDSKTRDALQHHLSSNANDTFLWVALVCQNLKGVPKRNVIKKLSAFPPGLDSLYEQMMQHLSNSDDASVCKEILAIAAVVYRPITLEEMAVLIEQLEDVADDPEVIQELIGHCGSFLTLRENTVYFVHQSAKDFLLAKASSEIFPSGEREIHRRIYSKSLELMSRTLRRDIYGLGALAYPIEQVKQPNPDPLIASRYSCIYWIDHFCDSDSFQSAHSTNNMQQNGTMDTFFKEKYLYWLEALSLCKGIPKGIISMTKLERLIKGRTDMAALAEFVQDARRFAMYHKVAIESSPLQTYLFPLLCSPKRSLVRHYFKHELPRWIRIKPNIEEGWSPCIQTLEGHADLVRSVAFKHKSSQLATGGLDRTVKIWDVSSGECLQTLKGDDNWVTSIDFNYDSSQLVASFGNLLKLWDVSSGECLQTFEGHSNSVGSVVFNHDSSQLASASQDETVKLWDMSTGKCLQTFEGHSNWVYSVVFNHDSSQLASGSYDQTVKLWDVSTGKCVQSFEDHSDSVNSVVFNHDSNRLASASHDKTVKLWDVSSGKCLQTLEGHGASIRSLAFNHNSSQLASGSADTTIKLWDVSNGECLVTLEGHSGSVVSMDFNYDSTQLASASWDKTVKIWDVSSSKHLQTLESLDIIKGHSSGIFSVILSHDSSQLASASEDRTVKLWDVSSGECAHTFQGHNDGVMSVAINHDSSQLASAARDGIVKLWDVSSGKCLHTLEGHRSFIMSVVFNHDSSQLATASYDKTVKLWDVRTGKCLQTFDGHGNSVQSVAFNHNSSQLASAVEIYMIKLWDIRSGECLQTLEGHGDFVRSLAFNHNSSKLASASNTDTVRIWDLKRGECVQRLRIGTRYYPNISFDSNDSYLFTQFGRINLSAATTLSSHPDDNWPHAQGIGLSLDGTWVTRDSENLLWLPAEYRPTRTAISGNTICVGVGSGKIWLCVIDS